MNRSALFLSVGALLLVSACSKQQSPGTALCITSLVLTYRVLARKVAALVRARLAPVNEDLALER